jgi:ribonuclease R
MTHRILFEFLNKIKQGNPVPIEDMSKWCSARELVAAKAQRDSIKYKQAEYLQDKIGKVFDGIVSGVTEWGVYVELIENKCEGMIRYNSLDGKYTADVNKYIASNELGESIRLGDEIKVVVLSVDLERKQVDFTMV